MQYKWTEWIRLFKRKLIVDSLYCDSARSSSFLVASVYIYMGPCGVADRVHVTAASSNDTTDNRGRHWQFLRSMNTQDEK